MKTTVVKGLNEQDEMQVTQEFIASAFLRKRFIHLFEEKIESLRRNTTSSTSYDSPSWAFMQADANGYERALREVISILESEKSKT